MKKILIALMVLVVALALVACGGTPDVSVSGDDQTTPPEEHVHAYEEELIPATCTATGKVITKCACGDVQSETELPVADHVQSVVVCDQDTVCTVCGAVLAEKTGHNIASAEVVTEATCSVPGKEKGACTTCGNIVESEIPASGHKANKNSVWTLVQGGYSTTCVSCNQTASFKEDTPVLSLTFEEAYDDEIAKYPLFKKAGKFTIVDDTDGDKAGAVDTAWLDVVDNAAMHALGSYVVTFDMVLTKDLAAGKDFPIFSILTYFAEGKSHVGGTTGWGYALRFNEDADKISTISAGTDLSKHTDKNSIAVEKNAKYTVQLIFSEGSANFDVFVNGKYLGKSGAKVTNFYDGTLTSLRFGDVAKESLVFDNIKICGIK